MYPPATSTPVGSIARAEADDAIARARIKSLREKAAKADDPTAAGLLRQEAEQLQEKRQPIPVAPRLIAEDVTSEHAATMLKTHGERLTIFSDEGGIFDLLGGRYSNNVPNLDVWLKSHSGSSAICDRGSRPSVMLHRPTLSMGIAPQPSVFCALVNNAVFRRRGICARFIFFLPPSPLGSRKLDTAPVPHEVADEYKRRLIELVEIPPPPDGQDGGRPRVLSLSPATWRLWKDFAHEVEGWMRTGGKLERLRDWAGKLPGAAARVAGLFHVAVHGPDAIRVDEVGHDSMARAIGLCRVATEHAVAVFEGLDQDGHHESARRLWREVEARTEERADPLVDHHTSTVG